MINRFIYKLRFSQSIKSYQEGFVGTFENIKNKNFEGYKISDLNNFFLEIDRLKIYRLGFTLTDNNYKLMYTYFINILENNKNLIFFTRFLDYYLKFIPDDINMYKYLVNNILLFANNRKAPNIFESYLMLNNKFEYDNKFISKVELLHNICNDVINMDTNYFQNRLIINPVNNFKLITETLAVNNPNINNKLLFEKLLKANNDYFDIYNSKNTDYLIFLVNYFQENYIKYKELKDIINSNNQELYYIIEKITYNLIEKIFLEHDSRMQKVEYTEDTNFHISGFDNISFDNICLIFKFYYNETFFNKEIVKNILEFLNTKFEHDIIDFDSAYNFLMVFNDNETIEFDGNFNIMFLKNIEQCLLFRIENNDLNIEYFQNHNNLLKWTSLLNTITILDKNFENIFGRFIKKKYKEYLSSNNITNLDDYSEYKELIKDK